MHFLTPSQTHTLWQAAKSACDSAKAHGSPVTQQLQLAFPTRRLSLRRVARTKPRKCNLESRFNRWGAATAKVSFSAFSFPKYAPQGIESSIYVISGVV